MCEIKKNIAVVIPALNPDERMVKLIKSLNCAGFEKIILVDDGSDMKNRAYFSCCEEKYGAIILRHALNLGKGTALKTAFSYILEKCPEIKAVVTSDCDGQHRPSDIEKVAVSAYENTDSLVLGVRSFNNREIPFRSRFGNKVTSIVLRLLTGLKVSDTQTGLRGFSVGLLRDAFAGTKGERFEYEMNELLCAKDNKIPIIELPIETIYIDDNESSHFNPFRDSIRIYKVFLKFGLSSFTSFLIDIFAFWALGYILRPLIPDGVFVFGISSLILIRTVLARLISSVYNFTINKTKVFNNTGDVARVALKYYALALVQLALSAFLVSFGFTWIPYSTVRKIIIDTLLFALSFFIQREWVFR